MEAVVAYLKYYARICLHGLMKTVKTLGQDSRSAARDLSPESPKFEASVLTTRPQRLIFSTLFTAGLTV
jgi:hypothetical protein